MNIERIAGNFTTDIGDFRTLLRNMLVKVGERNQIAFGIMVVYFRSFVMIPSEDDTTSSQYIVVMGGFS